MIQEDNFRHVLIYLGFSEKDNIFTRKFNEFDCELKADFKNKELIYPEIKGFKVNERQTCNFKAKENFVVFECIHRLLFQGYNPSHIELEPKWQVGHGASGGRADILVKDNDNKSLLIIECKTAGSEFTKAWNATQVKPTQLFSYVQQTRTTKFIALYASDFIDNQVISNYFLIKVNDNEKLLENNKNLKSYKEASTVEEIYQVWNETYKKDYSTIGLFENNKAYEIGKDKFSINDLKYVNSKDIQGKYNEFARILRQHNVSGRENAFDKLVNLFLCKVVDETTNKDDLQFYWKGNAYDNPFDFQDRIQKLYKEGMFQFLGEEITYIDENDIDNIFKLYDLKTIKEDMKEILKKQKFFTNSDFAFIDVHNEKLFYQNFEVFLKISRMIQDIQLTGSDENQFLGDMFEGFLDQGVKQSEGQFFTPMPLVKFIINSLPKKENPKVIDYACGAGHFLNEYARTNNKSKIIGIEKEYRLSKVAKVSSFMYGSHMDIIYDDALGTNKKIKNNDFDVLIANPPYSVKGFLETIKQDDRIKYELINTIEEKSYTANNSIECFFIEKSKQLLKNNGVAGIIVPSSILNKGSQSIGTNKGNVYVATREILLKYFDIVAIAEFGSETFGKTGTNTVTLFLKRRCDTENIADTFKELANNLYNNKIDFSHVLKDKDMINKYCTHIEIDFEVYKTILTEKLDNQILQYDIFKEYKVEFEKLSETKRRRTTKTNKAFTKEEKEKEESNKLLEFIKLCEENKFYYFCLAYKNSTDVIIVKAPSDGKENKKFLGYEWSGRKGSEGIKYFASENIKIDDENLEDDIRILENLQGLKHINTPLYNPQNIDDTTKINKIIKDNFEGLKSTIPKELETYVNRVKLVDMLDFTRIDFNKTLSLSPSKKVVIKSKYPLVKLTNISQSIIAGGDKPKNFSEEKTEKLNIPIYSNSVTKKGLYGFTDIPRIREPSLTVSARGTIGYTVARKESFYPIVRLIVITPKIEIANINYLEEVLNFYGFESTGAGVEQLPVPIVENTSIPLPPLKIQEQIVKECQKVDDEVLKANEIIEQIKKEIENEISSFDGEMVKLGDIFILQNGKAMSKNKMIDGNIPVYGGNGIMGYHNESLINYQTISIGRVGEYCGAVHITECKSWISDNSMFITEFKKIIDIKFIYFALVKLNLNQFANKTSQPNISQPIILSKNIVLPSIEIQEQIVSKIEELETKINEAKKIINSSKNKKEEILKNYL